MAPKKKQSCWLGIGQRLVGLVGVTLIIHPILLSLFFFTSLSKRLHGISKMFSIQDVAQYHKQKLKDPFLIQL